MSARGTPPRGAASARKQASQHETIKALARTQINQALAQGLPHPGAPEYAVLRARREEGLLPSLSQGGRVPSGLDGQMENVGGTTVINRTRKLYGSKMPVEDSKSRAGRERAIFRLTEAEEKRRKEQEATMEQMRTLLPSSSLALQSTLIEEAKAENQRISVELEMKKNYIQERMLAFDEQLRQLNEQKQQLLHDIDQRQLWIDSKKRRTEQDLELAQRRRVERVDIEGQIVVLREELARLREREAKQEGVTDQLAMYDQFLKAFLLDEGAESLLSATDAYSDGNDAVLKRYETLQETEHVLEGMVEETQRNIKEEQQRVNELRRQRTAKVLMLNTEIDKLQVELEQLKSVGEAVEATRSRQDEASKTTYRKLGQVMMAIDNLYSRVVERKHRKRRQIPMGLNVTQEEADAAAEARIQQHVKASGRAQGHYLHKLQLVQKMITFYSDFLDKQDEEGAQPQ